MKSQQITTAIEQACYKTEKDNSSINKLSDYQYALCEVDHKIVSLDVLHEFFNSKSDANKYLSAEQQEDLENEFHDYVLGL